MTKTLTHGYSSESTQRELSNEYQHDRALLVFKKLCILVFRMIEASALGGLSWCQYQAEVRNTGILYTASLLLTKSAVGINGISWCQYQVQE